MKNIAREALLKMGAQPHLQAYHFLLMAIVLTAESTEKGEIMNTDQRNRLISEQYDTIPQTIESGIRTIISRIKKYNSDLFQELFSPYKDEKIPSRLFISRVSEYVLSKMETEECE